MVGADGGFSANLSVRFASLGAASGDGGWRGVAESGDLTLPPEGGAASFEMDFWLTAGAHSLLLQASLGELPHGGSSGRRLPTTDGVLALGPAVALGEGGGEVAGLPLALFYCAGDAPASAGQPSAAERCRDRCGRAEGCLAACDDPRESHSGCHAETCGGAEAVDGEASCADGCGHYHASFVAPGHRGFAWLGRGECESYLGGRQRQGRRP